MLAFRTGGEEDSRMDRAHNRRTARLLCRLSAGENKYESAAVCTQVTRDPFLGCGWLCIIWHDRQPGLFVNTSWCFNWVNIFVDCRNMRSCADDGQLEGLDTLLYNCDFFFYWRYIPAWCCFCLMYPYAINQEAETNTQAPLTVGFIGFKL